MLWRLVLVFAALTSYVDANIVQGETSTLGTGPLTAFASLDLYDTIIARLQFNFDSHGLTFIQVCSRGMTYMGDGAVYSYEKQNCTDYGYSTGTAFVVKFTADEWPRNFYECVNITSGLIKGFNITTNLNHYFLAGDCFSCVRTGAFSTGYNEMAIVGVQTGERSAEFPPGIGVLQLFYLFCATSCASVYNGGGLCAIRNGGCDPLVNCTNGNSVTCGPCPIEYFKDTYGACQAIMPYELDNDTYVINTNTNNGTDYSFPLNYYPPYKISQLYIDWNRVNDSAPFVMDYFELQFTIVTNGTYDFSTTKIMSINGTTPDASTGDPSKTSNLTFNATEHINGYSYSLAEWEGEINTEIVNVSVGPVRFVLYSPRAPLQLFVGGGSQVLPADKTIVGFHGKSGRMVDQVFFILANTTNNCTCPPTINGLPACKSVQLAENGNVCVCSAGYEDVGNSCERYDFCNKLAPCANNSQCTPSAGVLGYMCSDCSAGYVGSGYTQCQDVDECLEGLHNCSVNATCTNLIGSFSCACNDPTVGNGYVCNFPGNNTCADECSNFATCKSTNGTYACVCNEGYFGSGVDCSPFCGNGFCVGSQGEDCVSCPQDCSFHSQDACGVCGDGNCASSEGCSSCPNDCGVCDPQKCGGTPECNNHGTCYNGLCTCATSWTGPLCDFNTDQTQPIEVATNQTTPSVTITTINQLNFAISVKRIVELRSDTYSTVQEIDLDNNTFTFNSTGKSGSSANVMWFYQTRLRNGAILNITIWQFEDPTTTYTFAGITKVFPQHTLKVNFAIANWPFMAVQNSLGIEMTANGHDPSTTSSTCSDFHEIGGSVNYITISYGSVTFYGQFLPTAVVDERFRNITYKSFSQNTVTAIVPHFWEFAEVDPDFSVLLGTKDPCTGLLKKENSKNKKILIAILVPVLVVAVVGGLLVAYYARLALGRQVRSGRRDVQMGYVNADSAENKRL